MCVVNGIGSRFSSQVAPIFLQRICEWVCEVGCLANDGNETSGTQQVVVVPAGAVGVYLVDGVISTIPIQVRVA
jgi:hypothetical protein